MGDWLVIIGAGVLLAACGVMFGELMELRAVRDDPAAVSALMDEGMIGNRWIRLGVQVLVLAALASITWGVVVGV